MDVSANSGQLSGMAGPGANNAYSQGAEMQSAVSYDNGSQLPSDFTAVLESYRAKSDMMESKAKSSISGDGANSKMLRQLSDLYNYSVDTQLLVRASSQVTSGIRQLMSGQ